MDTLLPSLQITHNKFYRIKDDLPWVQPFEVDDCQEEVKEGGCDYERGKQPGQFGQQGIGFVLLFKGSELGKK